MGEPSGGLGSAGGAHARKRTACAKALRLEGARCARAEARQLEDRSEVAVEETEKGGNRADHAGSLGQQLVSQLGHPLREGGDFCLVAQHSVPVRSIGLDTQYMLHKYFLLWMLFHYRNPG